MSAFDDSLTAGLTAIRAFAGVSVIYRDGGAECPLVAAVGRSEFVQENSGGFVQTIETRDYFVAVADLKLEGIAVTPRAGAIIEETIAGETRCFKVLADADVPPFVYSDPAAETEYRIHTKRVGASS